jgi:hypothetical protein
MKLNLISLYLATGVWAVPSPLMGGPDSGNDLPGLLGTAMAKMMTPLPLHKKTTSLPVSKKPGAIREQLYYGPLALKTVVVSDDDLTQYLEVTSYRKN